MAKPSGDRGDDLKRVRGVGPVNEAALNASGIWSLAQIAAWNSDNIAWIEARLGLTDRLARERWVEQARALVAGATTASE